MISVPDLAWGSVVGNTLERGFGYTAHGEHAAVQCGLEVVVADGDVVRTGMRAMDGCRSWTLYRGAFGPSLEGLFSQSNLGIVTKMDRSHLDHMDLAAEQYRFGDHAALRLLERLKDALDPDGILAPGKQGVWPARLRVPVQGGEP